MKTRLAVTVTALLFAVDVALSLPTLLHETAPVYAAGVAQTPIDHQLLLHHAALVNLASSMLPNLKAAQRVSALPADRPMAVALDLRLRNSAALLRFLKAVYDPHSPLFHHFLTPQQFAARFAPTPTQQRQLENWLRARGLHIVQHFANGLQVTARGSVAQIEAAFGTRLYHYREGVHSFIANSSPVQVPRALAPEIAAVAGLTDADQEQMNIAHSHLRREDTNSPNGGYSPHDLATLYNLQPLHQVGVNGSGQTIALVEFDNYRAANIAVYDKRYGITSSLTRIPVNDGQSIGAELGDGQVEVELDIEVVQAIAPGAQILVYEAANSDGNIAAISMYNQVVSDDRAKIISISWDAWERRFPPDVLVALNAALEEAAAQGQSVFAAAGDNAAFGAVGYTHGSAAKKPAVRFPGSSPWVTTVGGTTLNQNSDGSYGGETVWADDSDPKNPVGSGGGLSTIFKRPPYQVGPGVVNQYSNGMRQEPDVAADADPNTGYAIYTVDDSGKASWQELGGTSAAAPLWAAYAALVNQALGQPVGFFNPTLYALGQKANAFPALPFHDITRGNNLFYPATPGWDFASGWGSLNGKALIDDIQQMGGLVVARPPSVDIDLQAKVAKRTHGHYVQIHQLTPGRTIYLTLIITVNAVPDNSTGLWHLLLSTAQHTLYQHTFIDEFQHSNIGRIYRKRFPFRVPRRAPPGRYTFQAQLTIDGITAEAATQMRVR
jgi:subtilase family serine protease